VRHLLRRHLGPPDQPMPRLLNLDDTECATLVALLTAEIENTRWPLAPLTRPDVRVRRQPVEVARLEVSSKAFCNATGVAPMKEPIPRH
jgi:hypothetical protein